MNQFLIELGVLDIHRGEVVGFVVETACSYFRPVAFPDRVNAGIRVVHEDRLFKRPFFLPTAPRTRQNRGHTAPDVLYSTG